MINNVPQGFFCFFFLIDPNIYVFNDFFFFLLFYFHFWP